MASYRPETRAQRARRIWEALRQAWDRGDIYGIGAGAGAAADLAGDAIMEAARGNRESEEVLRAREANLARAAALRAREQPLSEASLAARPATVAPVANAMYPGGDRLRQQMLQDRRYDRRFNRLGMSGEPNVYYRTRPMPMDNAEFRPDGAYQPMPYAAAPGWFKKLGR